MTFKTHIDLRGKGTAEITAATTNRINFHAEMTWSDGGIKFELNLPCDMLSLDLTDSQIREFLRQEAIDAYNKAD